MDTDADAPQRRSAKNIATPPWPLPPSAFGAADKSASLLRPERSATRGYEVEVHPRSIIVVIGIFAINHGAQNWIT